MSVLLLSACGVDVEEQDSLKESAITQMDAGEYEKALAQINEALSLAGRKVTAREIDLNYYKGACQSGMEDYDDAIATYSALIEYDTKDEKAYFLRACAKVKNGDVEGAVSDFKDAFSLSGDDEMLLQGFISLVAEGYTDEAKAFFEETKDSMTDRARVLYEQISVMESEGNFTAALRAAEEYLKLKPEDELVSREYDFLRSVAE